MAKKEEIERFLIEFKQKISFWGLVLRSDRSNNFLTMAELELTTAKIKIILNELTSLDYTQGPEKDTLYKMTDMWMFGKEIKNREVYIKITFGLPGQEAVCISFHFSEHPLVYPFKT